ncbi:MAG: hypothetical protein WD341_06330 [Tistlia sp.]|uniref:hypothetical protein n=1 Tax=Tistlia sp. TaxID=3057121 RepID=UPI0034A28FAC
MDGDAAQSFRGRNTGAVQPGIARKSVNDLPSALGIPVEETDLDPYDVLTAEEGS